MNVSILKLSKHGWSTRDAILLVTSLVINLVIFLMIHPLIHLVILLVILLVIPLVILLVIPLVILQVIPLVILLVIHLVIHLVYLVEKSPGVGAACTRLWCSLSAVHQCWCTVPSTGAMPRPECWCVSSTSKAPETNTLQLF